MESAPGRTKSSYSAPTGSSRTASRMAHRRGRASRRRMSGMAACPRRRSWRVVLAPFGTLEATPWPQACSARSRNASSSGNSALLIAKVAMASPSVSVRGATVGILSLSNHGASTVGELARKTAQDAAMERTSSESESAATTGATPSGVTISVHCARAMPPRPTFWRRPHAIIDDAVP